MFAGKFHGTMRPTTPSGSRNVAATPPGDGDRLAAVLVDGAGVEVEDLRDHPDLAARPRDRLADVLRLDPCEFLGVLLDERREPRRRRARSAGATALHAGNAAFARATASSVSSTPACSSSAIGSSVAGLTTVSVTVSLQRPAEASALPHAPDPVDDPREHGDDEQREDPERLPHARERRRRLSQHVRDEDDGQTT